MSLLLVCAKTTLMADVGSSCFRLLPYTSKKFLSVELHLLTCYDSHGDNSSDGVLFGAASYKFNVRSILILTTKSL